MVSVLKVLAVLKAPKQRKKKHIKNKESLRELKTISL